MSKNTTYTYMADENTQKVIESIAADQNLGSGSEVLRRAITLLKLASDAIKDGKTVTIDGIEVSI